MKVTTRSLDGNAVVPSSYEDSQPVEGQTNPFKPMGNLPSEGLPILSKNGFTGDCVKWDKITQ